MVDIEIEIEIPTDLENINNMTMTRIMEMMMALTEDKQRPEWTLETGERRGQFRERGKLNDSRARDGDDLGEEKIKTKIGLMLPNQTTAKGSFKSKIPKGLAATVGKGWISRTLKMQLVEVFLSSTKCTN